MLFYFNLIKRFVQSQFYLSLQTLAKLIKYVNQNWNKITENEKLKEDFVSNLQETVEEVYSTLALMCWHFNNKMSDVLTKKPIENISIHQFTKFNALFAEINIFLQEELKLKEKLENCIQTNIEEVKVSLLDMHEDYIQKMNFDHLFGLKEQSGRSKHLLKLLNQVCRFYFLLS